MSEHNYHFLKSHYENCYSTYGDNHKGVDWPNAIDTSKRFEVMTDLMKFKPNLIDKSKINVLDLGCGLSHLYEYWTVNKIEYNYIGSDISEVFINRCNEKFPYNSYFCADLLIEFDKFNLYDFTIANGLFTEKLSLSFNEMWSWVKEMISNMLKISKFGIACNFMSKNVDWERNDLFHLPLDLLTNFVTKENKRFLVRNDYLDFEYTIYILKNYE